MAKKEKISIFGQAKVKTAASKAKDDKEVVYIDGLEPKLLELEFLKAQIKDLEAQLGSVSDEIKNISKEKFVKLYQENKSNPNTFLIKDGEGCVMVIPTDKYISIKDEDRANQLIDEYGDDIITTDEKYYFNPQVLERNMEAIEKLIMDAKTISNDDKRNLLVKEVKYSISKGYIDKLAQYGSKIETVLDDIQPIITLKNCGGKMEEGGEMGSYDFIANVYEHGSVVDGEYAKGGGINSGRDNLFKSQEPHEQRYKRKREWKEYKKEGWFGDWFKNGGGVGEINPQLNKKIFARAEEIYASIKGKNKKDFDDSFDKAIIEYGYDPSKYHSVMRDVGAMYDDDIEDYANGGNVGRDLLFKSQEPHEQKYKRKREWKEYKKENWFGDWFANGGGVGKLNYDKDIEVVEDEQELYRKGWDVSRIGLDLERANKVWSWAKDDTSGYDWVGGGYSQEPRLFKDKKGNYILAYKKYDWASDRYKGDKFSNGGGIEDNFDYGSDLTDEAMVKDNLMNGEISCETLTKIIGCKPSYPYQIVGAIKLEKCYLRPYYKLA